MWSLIAGIANTTPSSWLRARSSYRCLKALQARIIFYADQKDTRGSASKRHATVNVIQWMLCCLAYHSRQTDCPVSARRERAPLQSATSEKSLLGYMLRHDTQGDRAL